MLNNLMWNSRIKVKGVAELLIREPDIHQDGVTIPFTLDMLGESEDYYIELDYDNCQDAEIFDNYEQINQDTVKGIMKTVFIDPIEFAVDNLKSKDDILLTSFGADSNVGRRILKDRGISPEEYIADLLGESSEEAEEDF